jgi:hypothetical protein
MGNISQTKTRVSRQPTTLSNNGFDYYQVDTEKTEHQRATVIIHVGYYQVNRKFKIERQRATDIISH